MLPFALGGYLLLTIPSKDETAGQYFPDLLMASEGVTLDDKSFEKLVLFIAPVVPVAGCALTIHSG